MRKVDSVLTALHEKTLGAPEGGWPSGAPDHEFLRSPAAARVGQLASREGLFLFHYEHRAHVSTFSGVPDGVDPSPEWVDGVLPEPKYASFRHDLAVGSFHPGHRAKWTTHELCHALVGFAWAPDAGRLFHATAARLAELVPVALWYGLDEVRLRRCPAHAGKGPLYRTFCRACEAAAEQRALGSGQGDRRFIAEALRFVDAELAAVAKTRRLGRPVAHRWGTLDLCSDGLAYAVGHESRLNGASFHRFAEAFLVKGGGWVDTLDDLEARAVAVFDALCGQEPLAPLTPNANEGRWRWTAQDLAWRLYVVLDAIEGDRAKSLEGILEDLAGRPSSERAVQAAVEAYAALAGEGDLPPAEVVLAVGYDLPGGFGRTAAQVVDGLASVVPLTLTLLEDARPDVVDRFVQDDVPVRIPLGDRFAGALSGDLAELARYESALRTVRSDPTIWTMEAGSIWEASPEAVVFHGPTDWVRLAERAESGGVALSPEGRLRTLDDEPVALDAPHGLGIARDASGGLVVAELPPEVALALRSGQVGGLDESVREELAELSLLRPSRTPLRSESMWSEDSEGPTMNAPPRPEARPVEATHHGDTRVDDYTWLRDRSDPAVRAHLDAENAFTDALTEGLKPRVDAVVGEVIGRLQETDATPPARRGEWGYYRRTVEGLEYKIWCRRAWPDGPEEVLLDENLLAEGQDYMKLGVRAVSPAGDLLAYSTDHEGNENYTLRVRHIATGEEEPDVIPNTRYSIAWANDGRTLFYTVADAMDRPHQVIRHTLGADVAEDEVVFEERDERFHVSVDRAEDGRRLLIHTGGKTTTEVWMLDADRPEAGPVCVWARREGVEAYVTSGGDVLYGRTNDTHANFRLLESRDEGASWSECVAGNTAVYLDEVQVFSAHLVLWERCGGSQRLRVMERAHGASYRVDFDEPAYALSQEPNLEYDTRVFRYAYSALSTPKTTYDLELTTRARTTVKQEPVWGGFQREDYEVERHYAVAQDGTRVPISLARRRGVPSDGTAPGLLFGYGAYGLSYDPGFRSTWVSLLDRGVVVAIAHIRGGGENGAEGYEQGKFLQKRNTFTDFIACAEQLIGAGCVAPDRLAVTGGSAGGLLMGAVVNARPDLFRAVLARVPFVDSLNTMLDATLPLTVTEYDEWGDPNDPVYYAYMKSYAPYENVGAQAYPTMLVTAGFNDPRVGYWEPAKWVAKLRDHTTAPHPILLKTNMGAGHAGASGRYGWIREVAFDYAWILEQLQVE